jgi:hemerythrin
MAHIARSDGRDDQKGRGTESVRTPPQKIRQAELAKIHLAKKQLCLDDEAYRAMIERITKGRTDSSGEMTEAERRALLDEFARKGFQSTPPRAREDDWITIDPNHPGAQHLKKLLACAYELERVGAVSANSTGRWLQKFVRKITGVERLQWLDAHDSNKVIEALKGWRNKWLIKHPSAENKPVVVAIPASAIVKASVFDAMRLVGEAGSPIEGIRNFMVLLDSQNFTDAQIAGRVAELVRQFGKRARAALLRWDFKKVRSELFWLVERVAEADRTIAENMRAALKAEDGEAETEDAARSPRNKNRKR